MLSLVETCPPCSAPFEGFQYYSDPGPTVIVSLPSCEVPEDYCLFPKTRTIVVKNVNVPSCVVYLYCSIPRSDTRTRRSAFA